MRSSILTDEQAAFLRDEKTALAEIRLALAALEAPREALDTLQNAIVQLDELFLLVIAGEFNAGKSALVNALLGEKALAEGATPTTSRVTLVKWGEAAAEQVIDEGYAVYTYPLPLLKELNIVDTPGANAVIRLHERLTEEFIPRSDLVLFITSADRPMTESERQFLERIRAWGKKVVCVLNKVDLLEDEASRAEVRNFVLQHAGGVLGSTPEYFPVSARLRQRAWAEPDPALREQLRAASGLDALEAYIAATLDDAARLRLKFENPLGVGERLVAQMEQTHQVEADGIQEDRETVVALETSIAQYERELRDEIGPRLAEIENILNRLEQRGLDFFDSTLRLTKIGLLAQGEKVRRLFEEQVLSNVPQQIDDNTQRLIDWLVQKDLRQWQQVLSYLQRRQARHVDHLVGEAGGPQDTRRRELIDTVGKTAQTIIDTYDRDREASELAAAVEAAVLQTALLEAGAVGLGALVAFVVASSALDVTGMVAAGTLSILGLFVIPYKRKQARDNFKEKMQTLRDKLNSALTTQFTHESESSVARLRDGVAPYTRYIHSESERIQASASALAGLRQRLSALRARIQKVL